MKSVNAKRIAALAASVALGIAFAAPVSFSNIPIVNSAGQPVVQVVVGSTAMPSDGVVAANIAAVIGNLAFTSTPVTATVGGTSQLSCAVTAPSCTLSNQQVYLGEKGSITASGSYSFKGLIGSVMNAGLLNYNTLNATKNLHPASDGFAYPQGQTSPYAITSTPTATSPLTGVGPISLSTSVTSSVNGGGVQFNRMTQTGGYDNIVRFSNAQVPGLMQNSGPYSESEYLWSMGFPVFDQASGVNNLAVLDAGAAYQVTFGNPISVVSSGNVNHAAFQFDGANWTVFNVTLPTGAEPTSANFVTGGKLQLASASTPLQTVYVGQNVTSGGIKVTLQDLSYPNSNGVADAALSVYNNGKLTNETSVVPGTSLAVNSSGTKIYLYVQQTFPGLYSYQKWAKVQLFSSITNVTSGKVFNNEPGWYSEIQWTTNQSTVSANFPAAPTLAGSNAEIAGLVLYSNQSQSTTLTPGSTMAIGSNYKLTFAGDSFGTPGSGNSNYDPLTLSVSNQNGVTYANPATGASTSQVPGKETFSSTGTLSSSSGTIQNVNTTVITEPVDWLTVTSAVPTAFEVLNTGSFSAPASSSQVQYVLDGFQYNLGNAIDAAGVANVLAAPEGGTYVTLTNSGVVAGNYVSNNNQFTVTVTGYKPGSTSASSAQFTFNALGQTQTDSGFALGNVTNIGLSYAVPNGVSVNVYETTNVLSGSTSYSSSPVSQTLVPTNSVYLSSNSATSNTVSSFGANTLKLTVPANIIYTGQSDILSAVDSNSVTANIVLEVSYGANTFVTNTITNGNTVTQNADVLGGLIASATSPTFYTVNAFIPGTSYFATNTLLVIPSVTLSYANNAIASGTSMIITASTSANALTSAASALSIQVNGASSANNIAGSNSVTFNSDSLGVGTYSVSANVIPYSKNAASANQVLTSNTLIIEPALALLGTLSYAGPLVAYKVPQYNYYLTPNAASANVLYTVESSTNLPFTLTHINVKGSTATSAQNYFTYTMPEITVPQATTATANVVVGLYNASTILSNPTYWLNQTNGNNNDLQYQSSQGLTVKAPVGFRTERGGEVASISTTSVTYDMAKGVDTLQFLVGPGSSTVTTSSATYGPYGVGQATNIPNVTIESVNATCSFKSAISGCSVSGISNLTGVPSVNSVENAVGLNPSTTPLAVLDSQANNASTLVVVGSSYVNTVAQQIFAQNPGFASSFGPSSVVVQAFGTNRILVAGYSANQTVQAGNQFIQDLLQSAAATPA